MASHSILFTPGICSALNVMLYSNNVSTSGLVMRMMVLCLLVCLFMIATIAELSQ